MLFRHNNKHQRLTFAFILLLLLDYTTLHADQILVIGDDYASMITPELQSVFTENGHNNITVEFKSLAGQQHASDLSTVAGLSDISTMLAENPDATMVHLCIGRYDWYSSNWELSWAGTEAELSVISAIIEDVEIIVDHVISLRPDIQILWQNYDFPRPILHVGAKPPEVNAFWIRLSEEATQFAMAKPGFSFVDLNGTLQVAYGFDGQMYTYADPDFAIPAGDPSLPNPDYPSPLQAFQPNYNIFLTQAGYKILAQVIYDQHYAPLLAGENFSINAGLNGNWWNGPARSGEGVQVEVSAGAEGSLILVATVYSYDTLGNQIFVITVGAVNGDTAEVDVFITEGGKWGDDFDPALVKESQWGTGTFSATSCDAMYMELRPNAEYQALGYTNLVYNLIRLTAPAIPCPIDNAN